MSGTARRPSPIHPLVNPPNASSAPSSVQLRSPLTSGSGMSNAMPSSGSEILQPHQVPLPPAVIPRSSGYMNSFQPSISSPGTNLAGFADFGQHHAPFIGMADVAVNSQIPSSGMHGQKRAYRQRRKDPSCDTCRERKVKVTKLVETHPALILTVATV